MQKINASIRALFQRSSAIKVASLLVSIALLAGCAVGVWNALTAPTEKQQKVTRLTYALRGDFGYSATLGNNTLYGNVTLTEKDTRLLLLKIIDSIEGKFSYSFTSDLPLQQATHTVRVVATLSNPDNWSKEIELVSEMMKTDSFTLIYPIDTPQLFELAKAIEEQIGIQTNSYNLAIVATVHTVSQTDYGTIDELLTMNMSGTLQPTKLTWAKEPSLTQTRYGSLQDAVVVPIDRGPSRIGWSVALGIMFLLTIYIAWNYTQAKALYVTPVEKEARQAMKKHEDIIVSVAELPAIKAADMVPPVSPPEGSVISVSSLDDLIKVSETLVKPVLHKAERDKHVYCVIDGTTKYEYVALEQRKWGTEL